MTETRRRPASGGAVATGASRQIQLKQHHNLQRKQTPGGSPQSHHSRGLQQDQQLLRTTNDQLTTEVAQLRKENEILGRAIEELLCSGNAIIAGGGGLVENANSAAAHHNLSAQSKSSREIIIENLRSENQTLQNRVDFWRSRCLQHGKSLQELRDCIVNFPIQGFSSAGGGSSSSFSSGAGATAGTKNEGNHKTEKVLPASPTAAQQPQQPSTYETMLEAVFVEKIQFLEKKLAQEKKDRVLWEIQRGKESLKLARMEDELEQVKLKHEKEKAKMDAMFDTVAAAEEENKIAAGNTAPSDRGLKSRNNPLVTPDRSSTGSSNRFYAQRAAVATTAGAPGSTSSGKNSSVATTPQQHSGVVPLLQGNYSGTSRSMLPTPGKIAASLRSYHSGDSVHKVVTTGGNTTSTSDQYVLREIAGTQDHAGSHPTGTIWPKTYTYEDGEAVLSSSSGVANYHAVAVPLYQKEDDNTLFLRKNNEEIEERRRRLVGL
ncbi:unnamed protein product [Amoebophrya sp. A120]|nr:unnamed protein product [Amoebophrya sp. A120]|eukprot:GSA120T00013252001.1